MEDAPIERYLELAAVVESAVNDYVSAKKRLPKLQKKAEKEKAQLKALKNKLNNTMNKLDATERDIKECQAFFLSDRFDIFMPTVDGDKFLQLLDAKIEHEMNPESNSNEEHDTQGS